MIFGGRVFAEKIEIEIRDRVKRLARRPKLVTIVDPANQTGVKYTQLKTKMAQGLGVEFQILNPKSEISNKFQIQNLNNDPTVDGIMIQLPFPGSGELIPLIDPAKDIDGLREDSPFQPAVVRAVMEILGRSCKAGPLRIVLMGSRGFVGRKLMRALAIKDYPFVAGVDKDDFDPEKLRTADVVISCTGQAGLIDGSTVKSGFMAIDVGYPKAEFTADALAKASWYTPVPGGVGPVTVAMLFKNLIDAVKLADEDLDKTIGRQAGKSGTSPVAKAGGLDPGERRRSRQAGGGTGGFD